MSKYARAISAVATVSACAMILAAQASEGPFVGTWKLNVAKSKFSPGPAPKSQTVTIAQEGKFTVDEIFSDGTSHTWSFTPSGDSPVAVQGRRQKNATVLHKRHGNVTEDIWSSEEAKTKGRAVLSPDGQTVTYTQTGADKDGHPIRNVAVYDRASETK